jgi:CRP-like cAMP-binding protein
MVHYKQEYMKQSNDLVAWLSRHMELSDDLAELLLSSVLVKKFAKGTILLRQGDIPSETFFVLRGCVRSYTLKDGDDTTIEFYLEEEPILPIGFGSGERSVHFLECMEDTVAVASSPEQEERMLKAHPELKTVCLGMAELMAAKLQSSFANYKTATPEERYTDLLQRRPELIQRVPLYHIASYLGVKPETLSRIRGKIGKKSGDAPIS